MKLVPQDPLDKLAFQDQPETLVSTDQQERTDQLEKPAQPVNPVAWEKVEFPEMQV